MQNLNNAKVEGNRFELGDWYLMGVIVGAYTVEVWHKTDGRKWNFYTWEEALEAIK